MASITITIPDVVMPRVVVGLCGQGNYQAVIDGVPNPETKGQFAKRYVLEWIRREVVGWESRVAQDVARESAVAQTETDLEDMS